MNKELLVSAMAEYGDTQKTLAEYLGLNTSTLNRKINNSNGSDFTVPEMMLVKERYNLSSNRALRIFFGREVKAYANQ